MTRPVQGTLENSDGAWVLTLVRDFGQPVEKLWAWDALRDKYSDALGG
ncbi:MAG TPA: hypothetical protein VMS92_19530 [Mycobacterium sp.]|nr:hypothetical protein [Mycobacterium sp.]